MCDVKRLKLINGHSEKCERERVAVECEHVRVIGVRDECSLSSFAQSSLYLVCVTLYTCFVRWVGIAMAIPLDALWSSCIHALSSYLRLSLRRKVAFVDCHFLPQNPIRHCLVSASVIWPIYEKHHSFEQKLFCIWLIEHIATDMVLS